MAGVSEWKNYCQSMIYLIVKYTQKGGPGLQLNCCDMQQPENFYLVVGRANGGGFSIVHVISGELYGINALESLDERLHQ